MSDPYFERPDLAPLRAAASQAEFAEAFRRLLSADGYRLAEGEPLATPARDVARSRIEAGFTLHHCDRYDLPYRLGGVCLMPVPAEFGTCRSGTAVSWTTRNLLLLDWDRQGIYRRAHQLMNAPPGGVLDTLAADINNPNSVNGVPSAPGGPFHNLRCSVRD